MWASFILASLCALAILYVPGYVLVRALRFSPIVSLVCAPLVGTALLTVLPVAYYPLGIPCTSLTLVVPALAIPLLAYAASRATMRPDSPVLDLPRHEPIAMGSRKLPFAPAILVAYILVATIVCLVMFVGNLPTPEAFYSRYDNQTHLNMVQAFVDSGKWSTLHASNFLASPEYAQAGTSTAGSFYPAAWHVLAALVCCLSGTKVTVASNALITALCALVFPSGMFLLFNALFRKSRRLVAVGALITSSFATWPWVFIIKGPCLPNLLGFALMASFIAVVLLAGAGLARGKLPSLALFALMGLVALALAHPNTVFTAFVFLAAYAGHLLDHAVRSSSRIPDGKRRTAARIGAMAAYLAALAAFWVLCYRLPFLDSVLSYRWSEKSSLLYALATLGSLNMVISGVQWALIATSVAGVVRCVRERRIWLLVPVLFFATCYLVSKCGIDPLKYWLASLWYQTPYRFTACISVFLMPVAALGLDAIASWADRLATRRFPAAAPRLGGHVGTAIVIVLFSVVNFAPGPTVHVDFDGGHDIQTSFAMTERRISNIYRDDVEHVYSAEEVAFVDKVVEAIPEGALVLNQPNDGSVFAYGVNHLNTYFRHGRAGKKNETAREIQQHLADYATDPEARAAVEKTGARYLLLLDQGKSYEDGVWLPQFGKSGYASWPGIDAVRDDTPGFTIVLAEGDMRLYKLDALDEAA